MASAGVGEPPKKKRRLPRLDDSFDEPKRPSDSPELHQGRTRAAPHVRGQWASHVYLELTPSAGLRKVLRKSYEAAVDSAAPTGAAIHSLLPDASTLPRAADGAGGNDDALHLSLSRPLMLLTNQRDDLRKAVARIADRFEARYASFGVLENDEKTRRFLGVEVGQGYAELLALVRDLDKALAELRLPAYYPEPRFHASLAWTTTTSASVDVDPTLLLPFADQTLDDLDASLGPHLRKEGQVWVGELCVKIGKEVSRFRLSKSR
ncbi:hypothetical protein JCM3774_005896 [Rhodotorula dairenensis]